MTLALHKKEAVAEVFEATDLGAPFKVVLHESVHVHKSASGELLSYTIPDVPQLLLVALIARLLIPRKLGGDDIKFVRKVLGIKQVILAKKLGFKPEHLSRCENSASPLSPQGDKLLRIFAFKEALKLPDMPKSDPKAKLEEALDRVFEDMNVISAYDVEDALELHFVKSCADAIEGGDCGSDWSENSCKVA